MGRRWRTEVIFATWYRYTWILSSLNFGVTVVAELQKGFFCQNEGCKFAIWKNSKWWELKRKQPTKAIVTALLKDGRAHVTGLYSEKTGKTYDATVVLEDDGQYANFKLAFGREKGGKR